MNSFSPLGLLACFIFSFVLTGSPDISQPVSGTSPEAYVINNSPYTVYFKPESKEANPGLQSDAAYAIAPGQTLYAPVDGVVTPAMMPGKIFRIPTGAKIIINEKGLPQPANLIARGGLLFPAYGDVRPPSPHFAKLANSKQVLYKIADVIPAQLQ